MRAYSITCEDCDRRFGGWFTFKRHRPTTWDRCRTPAEMREIGLHRNRRGTWVRHRPSFQHQLDFRAAAQVRVWFAKPYRALTDQERQEYRRRLRLGEGAREPGTTRSADPRNAQRLSQATRRSGAA